MKQNWSILAKFSPKNQAKSAVFYWLFLGEVSPRNFPWHQPIFLTICPWKSRKIGRFFCEFWLFSRENPAKSADFSANFDFSPAKIPQNRPISPRILTFFPAKLADFSANFPLKIPRNFAFFSAKYQKPRSKYLNYVRQQFSFFGIA